MLVDTGLGQQDVRESKRRLGSAYPALFRPRLSMDETAISQIRLLGYDPRDVRHIVPTHVDLDHVGGLGDFPDAQVHIFKPELQHIQQPTPSDLRRFRLVQFDHNPKWVVHEEQGEQWFGFSSIRAIPGLSIDILLIPLIGHTRGHVGVAVKQGDRWLLHCGDAYYHHSQVTDAPDVPFGLAFFKPPCRLFVTRESRIYGGFSYWLPTIVAMLNCSVPTIR
ncbi:MBL fold metallo-hydrolase [Cupriavidus sp. D39]|uniref:MBL fold metallo-hydrolase n=1 Tax=Cupriavidus sp. D39 TaxID=2997877 RepID=UPI00226F6FA8|nr:MBL fold metallo-hydrolase [Cupriavidus sp. D39]MCY0854681.1 MBL fold metallo-hydrolase [Cupriavidus sp. D39]